MSDSMGFHCLRRWHRFSSFGCFSRYFRGIKLASDFTVSVALVISAALSMTPPAAAVSVTASAAAVTDSADFRGSLAVSGITSASDFTDSIAFAASAAVLVHCC